MARLARVIAGLALEAKYAVPFFLAPLPSASRSVRLAASSLTKQAALGVVAAVAIALPSVLWQAAHGLPFRELIHAASHGKNTVVPPLRSS